MALFTLIIRLFSGFVVRNSSCYPLLAMAKNLGSMEILIYYYSSDPDGLLAIPNPEFQKLIVEGDSKILIRRPYAKTTRMPLYFLRKNKGVIYLTNKITLFHHQNFQ
jgi:hypothetical protein